MSVKNYVPVSTWNSCLCLFSILFPGYWWRTWVRLVPEVPPAYLFPSWRVIVTHGVLFSIHEVSFIPIHLDRSFCIILDTVPCLKLLENSNTLVSSGSTLPYAFWHCYRTVEVCEVNLVLQNLCWYSQYTLSMCSMILFISINSFSCLAQGGSQTYTVLTDCGVERHCC